MARILPTLLLAAALAMAGCGSETVPTPAPGQAAATATPIEQWQRLAQAPYDELDYNRAVEVTNELLQRGELGLVLDVLADPDATPVAKVLAVVSLTPFLSGELVEPLSALTAPEHDATTRACAAKLLGTMLLPDMRPQEGAGAQPDPAVLEQVRGRLRALMADPEPRVRVTAVTMLAREGDEAALAQMTDLWRHPSIDANARMEIVRSLPPHEVAPYRAIYLGAAVDTTLDTDLRRLAVIRLGDLAGEDVLETLERAAEADPAPAVREIAEAAAAAVRGKVAVQGPADAELPETPASTSGEG